MAITETKPIKQLQELLQEKQEPFILDIYLVERGHLRKNSDSESSFQCCIKNSRKSVSRSGSCKLNKSKKGIPQCYKVLRTVYDQVISINERLKVKKSNIRNESFNIAEQDQNNHQAAELDRFSSASSTTVFDSCPESDAEEIQQENQISFTPNTSESFKLHNLLENEIVSDRKLQWQSIEDNKQYSPVSVLEDTPSYGGSPVHNNNSEGCTTKKDEYPSKTCVLSRKIVTEDSILSASLWKILFQHSTCEKPTCTGVPEEQEPVQSNASLPHLKSKMVLQQTRQLLFDYIKEVVEKQRKKGRQYQHYNKYLGSEEVGKLIGRKLRSLDKHSGDGLNMSNLLESEFQDSPQEWKGYEPHQRDIGSEIGNNILEDIIKEFVLEIIGFLSPITCS